MRSGARARACDCARSINRARLRARASNQASTLLRACAVARARVRARAARARARIVRACVRARARMPRERALAPGACARARPTPHKCTKWRLVAHPSRLVAHLHPILILLFYSFPSGAVRSPNTLFSTTLKHGEAARSSLIGIVWSLISNVCLSDKGLGTLIHWRCEARGVQSRAVAKTGRFARDEWVRRVVDGVSGS